MRITHLLTKTLTNTKLDHKCLLRWLLRVFSPRGWWLAYVCPYIHVRSRWWFSKRGSCFLWSYGFFLCLLGFRWLHLHLGSRWPTNVWPRWYFPPKEPKQCNVIFNTETSAFGIQGQGHKIGEMRVLGSLLRSLSKHLSMGCLLSTKQEVAGAEIAVQKVNRGPCH